MTEIIRPRDERYYAVIERYYAGAFNSFLMLSLRANGAGGYRPEAI